MDGTSCGSCGATNPPGATFCWQCYVPTAAPARAPVGPAGFAGGSGIGAPALTPRMLENPTSAPTPAPAGRRISVGRVLVWLLVLGVVAFGAWLIYINVLRGAPELPMQVGSMVRMTDLEGSPLIRPLGERLREEWTPRSTFGIYGASGGTVPTYIAIVGTGINPSLREHIDSLAIEGVSQTDLDGFAFSREGDIEIACGRVEGQTFATACVAKDGLNLSMVGSPSATTEDARLFTVQMMQGVG
ncbi:MAG: hypothetical protein WD206_00130 [Actinomycetota bacterium]